MGRKRIQNIGWKDCWFLLLQLLKTKRKLECGQDKLSIKTNAKNWK